MEQPSSYVVGQTSPAADRDPSVATSSADLADGSAGPPMAVSEGMHTQIEGRRPMVVDRTEERGRMGLMANESRDAENRSRRITTPTILGSRIRAERRKLGLSQQEFATALQTAGWAIGAPNGCTKRLVQKWERGDHRTLSPAYQLAFGKLTGVDYRALRTPLSPPEAGKATRALESCIIRLAEIEHELARFHRRLAELHDYMAGDPGAFLASTDASAD